METIAFIHGLNTYGDDDIHIGPLRFGPMHAHLETGLRARGLDFAPVVGVGAGPIEEQATRALAAVLDKIGSKPFHLLGQSTGGLVARVLAARLPDQVRCLVTIGTPHQGAAAAEFGLALPQRYPLVSQALATLGYDLRARATVFSAFTPGEIARFNHAYPRQPGLSRIYSLICSVPRQDVSWPLQALSGRAFGLLSTPSHLGDEPSDGFISVASQSLGECRGPFALDHFGEIGFFPHLSPQSRARARREFERLLDEIAKIVFARPSSGP